MCGSPIICVVGTLVDIAAVVIVRSVAVVDSVYGCCVVVKT